MGNSYAKAPDERFLEVIQNGGSLQEILLRDELKEEALIEVDMSFDNSDSTWKDHHDIVFSDSKPDSCYLIFLFPCHPVVEKQVLYTYAHKDVCALNRELNARLRESLQVSYDFGVVRLAIIYGSLIYCIRNMVGTCYLVWSSAITQTNHNAVCLGVQRDVPIIVNMDGYNQFEAVLPLRAERGDHSLATLSQPLNVSTCKFFVPFRVFLWTDEADPREHRRRLEQRVSVATAAQVESASHTFPEQNRWRIQREPPPFSASEASHTPQDPLSELDSDEEIMALSDDSSLYLSSVTPRLEERKLPSFKGLTEISSSSSSAPDENLKG